MGRVSGAACGRVQPPNREPVGAVLVGPLVGQLVQAGQTQEPGGERGQHGVGQLAVPELSDAWFHACFRRTGDQASWIIAPANRSARRVN